MVIRYRYVSICVPTVLNIYTMLESGLEFEKEYVSLKSASITTCIYLKYRLPTAHCRICKLSTRKFTYLRLTHKAFTSERLERAYQRENVELLGTTLYNEHIQYKYYATAFNNKTDVLYMYNVCSRQEMSTQ